MNTKKYIGDLFINTRWYLIIAGLVVLFFTSYFLKWAFPVVRALAILMLLLTLADYVLLFVLQGGLSGRRVLAPRFSIGDENEVTLELHNRYPYTITGELMDELPEQFQQRNFKLDIKLPQQSTNTTQHLLRPLTRGEYNFGQLLCYASTPIGFLQRRFVLEEGVMVKVYPAFQQMRQTQLQLMATNENSLPGVKKLRRLGHSMEFEKIKDYVQGDDVRTINWKATARSNNLMVNTYTDARQQQIYCLIDKGRNMKMPFEGMTLLDYAINSCLALLNVALLKQDKAGLITFSNKVNDVVPADRKNNQLYRIIETLYKQQTEFKESDYEAVWSTVRMRITQRSFILFFTNFETMSSLERQLPFLKKIAQNHLVCVIFFQNTLLEEIHKSTPDDIEGIYIKTIADQFAYEKRQIVKELRMHGMLSILTTPKDLSVDVINKYLEMKARQMA